VDEEAAARAAVERIADGWCGGGQPVFLYRLSRGLSGSGEIVEIGTFAGKSATALAMAQRDANGRPVHTIDIVEHPEVAKNLARLGVDRWVRRITGDSRAVAAAWTRPIELLFIDGGHAYAEARGDIDAWTPFVVEDGLVVVHDYPGWETADPAKAPRHAIHKAVHETLLAHPDRWQVVSDREHGSLVVFRRINPAPRYA
jgi:predicted O-methyltransferase YrrM